jgi:hypothetical protein
MKSIRSLLILYALAFSLIVNSNARADILSVDDPVFGIGSITRDTDTGMDWLDLTITQNRSFNDIASQFGVGGQFEGFRHATSTEVFQFFTNAGIPFIVTTPFTTFPSTSNVPSVLNLMTLWGITGSLPDVLFSQAFVADGPSPGVFFTSFLASQPAISAASASTRGSSAGAGATLSFVGHALVRPIPPRDAIELLIGEVESFVGAGDLTQDQADGLTDKLGAAIASLNRGNALAACNQLGTFINQANVFIRTGVLSPDKGLPLINAATAIRTRIGC